jgi:hypothetical protein
MNNYSIITVATVTTEYIVKAKNKEDAEEKFYDGEYIEEGILDYHDEQVDDIAIYEENVDA